LSPVESTEAVLDIYKRVIDTLGNVFSVTELQVEYTPLTAVSEAGESLRPAESTQIVESGDQVTSDDIRSAVDTSENGTDDGVYIQTLTSVDTRVQMYLAGGLHWIGRDTPERYKHAKLDGTQTEQTPQKPVYVNLSHRAVFNDEREEVGAETVCCLILSTRTDIWFQETPLRRINRARLAERLTALSEVLNTCEVVVQAPYGPSPPSFLETLLDYDGPSAERLIEKYRIEWVEEMLRERARGYRDGEARVADFGTVESDLPREELIGRLEAYLRAQDMPVDRVTVTTTDDTTLMRTVTDDAITWQS